MSELADEYGDSHLSHAKLVKDVLGLEWEAYLRYKDGVISGLYKFGTVFLQNLARCLETGTFKSGIKILNMFQQECVEHEMLWRIFLAKQKALSEGQSNN